jgi:hypothetical protein
MHINPGDLGLILKQVQAAYCLPVIVVCIQRSSQQVQGEHCWHCTALIDISADLLANMARIHVAAEAC